MDQGDFSVPNFLSSSFCSLSQSNISVCLSLTALIVIHCCMEMHISYVVNHQSYYFHRLSLQITISFLPLLVLYCLCQKQENRIYFLRSWMIEKSWGKGVHWSTKICSEFNQTSKLYILVTKVGQISSLRV